MYLSEEKVEFFDQNLKTVVKKFRPADGSVLQPEDLEYPFRDVLRKYAKEGYGRTDENFVDQMVQERIYATKNETDDNRVAMAIMYALDFYSRPSLMNEGYSDKEAYQLWSMYMAQDGDEKMMEAISDLVVEKMIKPTILINRIKSITEHDDLRDRALGWANKIAAEL